MSDQATPPCPCGKAKSYQDCCGPFISGEKPAKTPEQLMRSRYTAYALGGQGDYLLNTWFPATARGLTAAQLSEKKYRWQKLDVLHKSQNGDTGTVEFKAYFCPLADNNSTTDVLHEISEFRRLAGRWFYVGSRVT